MIPALFRLAFITACSAYVLGLVVVADWQGAPVAFLAGVIGVVIAVVLAQDYSKTAAPARGGFQHRVRRETRAYDGEG